jgi:hypothetical protein
VLGCLAMQEGAGPLESIVEKKRQKRAQLKAERLRGKMADNYAVIHKLPKNVPY